MTTYLYPEHTSKAAYRRALAGGAEITARELSPMGERQCAGEQVVFSGPHYPKAHRYYGKAVVGKNGLVVKIT